MQSSIEENWTRLELMHNVAKQLFDLTKNSEYRDPTYGKEIMFLFCPETVTQVQQEAAIVGMVKVWSFATLESLVNHAIANVFNNRMAAIIAIESPSKIVKPFKGATPNSELGQKILILNDDLGMTYDDRREEAKRRDPNVAKMTEELKLADEIAGIRNLVMRDKPFELNTSPEGEVRIRYYGTRLSEKKRVRYSDLAAFFAKCDQIREHIIGKIGDKYDGPGRSFAALLGD